MTTFTIFYGAEKPIKAVGKNQCRILDFAERYRCWHYMRDDRGSKVAYKALARKGCIEIEGIRYRFKYPE